MSLSALTSNRLGSQLEELAAGIISEMAKVLVAEHFRNLQDLMSEEALEFDAIRADNPYAGFRHSDERWESGCTIYQYRNVEGAHADLWECPFVTLYQGHRWQGGALYLWQTVAP